MRHKYNYKVRSNNNKEPLGTNTTLDERLVAIGNWFCSGDVDVKNYLWCLEEAFEHWGWTPPKSYKKEKIYFYIRTKDGKRKRRYFISGR